VKGFSHINCRIHIIIWNNITINQKTVYSNTDCRPTTSVL